MNLLYIIQVALCAFIRESKILQSYLLYCADDNFKGGAWHQHL